MKRLILSFALICVMLIGVNAQKKGLLDPIRLSDLSMGEKGLMDNMFLRFGATFTASTLKLGFDEFGEFTGINSAFLSRAGVVLGLAHYIEKNGVAVNNYSINGVIMTPTEGFSNLAIGATISAYNFSVGPGYDFIGGKKFKENIFLMLNAQILF
jgi:hypothetical protein